MHRLTTQQRRDLRAITMDGGFFSGMVGVGESYVPAFVLAVGLGDVAAGLVATLPMLAGALLQLATPWAVLRLGSYRRWVVACACLQAFSFVPLVVGGLAGGITLAWVAVATVAYWGFGMATGPAWNAWITSLVPVEIRPRFFAHRTRIAQGSLLAALLGGGLLLELGRAHGRELWLFSAIFTAALGLRMVSARCLASQSEEPGLPARHKAMDTGRRSAWLRRAGSRRLIVYLVTMTAATYVAAPFFTPYMLGPLELSYGRFMALTATAFVARLAVLPFLGRLVERRGARFVLVRGAWAIVPLPVLWLVSHDYYYLLGVQLVAGSAWAALELATMLALFEAVQDAERTRVLSIFNLANAAAVALGALAGSWIYSALDGGSAGYAALFVVSALGRLATIPLLRHAPAPEAHVAAEDVSLRTLAVRPSAGAIQRPILPTLEQTRRDPPDQA